MCVCVCVHVHALAIGGWRGAVTLAERGKERDARGDL